MVWTFSISKSSFNCASVSLEEIVFLRFVSGERSRVLSKIAILLCIGLSNLGETPRFCRDMYSQDEL